MDEKQIEDLLLHCDWWEYDEDLNDLRLDGHYSKEELEAFCFILHEERSWLLPVIKRKRDKALDAWRNSYRY